MKKHYSVVRIRSPPIHPGPLQNSIRRPQPGGFRCTFDVDGRTCLYVCGSEQNIKNHYSKEYHWQNPRGKGRPKEGPRETALDVPWRGGVLYQRLFVQRPKSGVFEVGRDQGQNEALPAIESQWEKMERMIDRGRARVAEAER
jgi:hypothetical protein